MPRPVATPEPLELELDVTSVAHGGVFVARHEGRVVFVADALPGERVRARLSEAGAKRFWRAETIEVLEASEDRREHIWPEASLANDPSARAGGAEFGHIRGPRQRALKEQVLREGLQRFARIDEPQVEVEALPGAEDGTGWRTRVSLHVSDEGVVGPYAARSHTVVPVADLPLATDAVREAIDLGERRPDAAAIDVVGTSVDGVRVRVTPRGGRAARSGPPIRERVREREFRLAEGGFWQVHEHAAETLGAATSGAIDPQLFDPSADNLDLYGGVGLLAAAVADRFGSATRITTVESDAIATEFAGENLAEWVGARAATARVDRFLADLERGAGAAARDRLRRATVVLDPPRAGAGKDVMAALARLRPAQLVYVACDPIALARDIGLARDSGYSLTSLRAFDLFPNTHHVEAVATLVRD